MAKKLSDLVQWDVVPVSICFLPEITSPQTLSSLMRELFVFIADYYDEVPGASAKDCGNYLDMNLTDGTLFSRKNNLNEVLTGIQEEQLYYPE